MLQLVSSGGPVLEITLVYACQIILLLPGDPVKPALPSSCIPTPVYKSIQSTIVRLKNFVLTSELDLVTRTISESADLRRPVKLTCNDSTIVLLLSIISLLEGAGVSVPNLTHEFKHRHEPGKLGT